MKAIRTIGQDPEWVTIVEWDLATGALPQIFPDTASLEGLKKYFDSHGKVFNPYRLPIEMVDIEIKVI